MSAELLSVSQPRGNNGSLQGTTVGAGKPIHRFLKGQPKILGVRHGHKYTHSHLCLIICGIMYVLTEHNPTKKTHMGLALEAVFVFYTLVGAVILIVMSALAGAALRSTKTQAVVMMTTASTETPTE
uniref:Uncharacterized protein n=1 Tax=Amphilophus citrinellus TaxID=61819 RepID=A0A3Q0QNF9_AMPCI